MTLCPHGRYPNQGLPQGDSEERSAVGDVTTKSKRSGGRSLLRLFWLFPFLLRRGVCLLALMAMRELINIMYKLCEWITAIQTRVYV